MRYEIINPSDKCYIYSDDVRLAKIACALLGNGLYGLKDETGETVLFPFEPVDVATGLVGKDELSKFIDDNIKELAKVFRSFKYDGERTSLNNIGARAEGFASVFEKEEARNVH